MNWLDRMEAQDPAYPDDEPTLGEAYPPEYSPAEEPAEYLADVFAESAADYAKGH